MSDLSRIFKNRRQPFKKKPPILDTFTGAAAAYSLSRKLRTAYGGSAVRLRRTNSGQFRGGAWTGSSFILVSTVAGFVHRTLPDGSLPRPVFSGVLTSPARCVVAGNVGGINRVVLGGDGGAIYTSDDDGLTWTARSSGQLTQFQSICRGTTNFVGAGGTNLMRYSPDGINWLPATGYLGSTNNIAANGDTIVAVGLNGNIYVSTDGGVNFAASASSGVVTTAALTGLAYSPTHNLWVACGAGGIVLTATNPAGTWTLYNNGTTPSTGTTADFSEVGYFPATQKFYCGRNGVLTVFDPVLVQFSQVSISGGVYQVIAENGSQLLIAGTVGAVFTTPNGTAFTGRTNITNNAESDIGFDTQGGLDTTALYDFVNVGNAFITTAYDHTTNARNIVNTTAANQPRLVLNGVLDVQNGKAMARAIDATDFLRVTGFSLSQPVSVFGVGTLPASGTLFDAGATADHRISNAAGAATLNAGSALTGQSTAGLDTFYSIANGATSSIAVNGAVTSGAAGANALNGITVLANRAGTSVADTYFGELIVYASDQSANAVLIEANQRSYYGIS